MKMEWKRVTAEISGPCGTCQDPTNRMFAFRKPTDAAPGVSRKEHPWVSIFFCDDCTEGMKSCPSVRPASG